MNDEHQTKNKREFTKSRGQQIASCVIKIYHRFTFKPITLVLFYSCVVINVSQLKNKKTFTCFVSIVVVVSPETTSKI